MLTSVAQQVRRAPSHVGFWVVVGAAAIFVIVGVVLPTIPVKGLTVRTVVETSEATTMAVYVNDLDAAAVSVPLAAGVDATTVLQLHSGGVDLIQLNFYGPVGEHIRLYSVQVLNGKRVLASSSGGDFSRWQMAFIYPTGQPARPSTSPSIVLATTEEGSALHETLDIPGPSSFPGAVEARDPLHRLSLSFWIGLGLGLSAWAMSRDRRSLAGVVIVVGIAVVGCLFLISQHTGGLTPAVSGVGRATYLGLSVASNLHAVEAMSTLAAVLGFAAGLGCRRIRLLVDRFFRLQPAPGRTCGRSKRQRSRAAVSIGTSGDDTDRTPTRPTRYRVPSHLINGALLATALVAAVAVLTPDILSDLHSAAVQTYVPGLDNDNGLAWQVFAERGLVPMKDFWYPYGNSSLRCAPRGRQRSSSLVQPEPGWPRLGGCFGACPGGTGGSRGLRLLPFCWRNSSCQNFHGTRSGTSCPFCTGRFPRKGQPTGGPVAKFWLWRLVEAFSWNRTRYFTAASV